MHAMPLVCLGKEVAREASWRRGYTGVSHTTMGAEAAVQAVQAFLGIEYRMVPSQLQLPDIFGFIGCEYLCSLGIEINKVLVLAAKASVVHWPLLP